MKSTYKKYRPYKVYPTTRAVRGHTLRHPKPEKQPAAQYAASELPATSPENPDAGNPFLQAAASDASFRAMIAKAQGA